MNQASEAELIEACLAGSNAAFTEFVDRYKHLVFGVISQVVSDRSQVDDLAQDVFLKVHRGLPSFRGDAKLSTWIFTATVMRQVERAQAGSPRSSFWAEEGLRLGLVLASVGLSSVIDVSELGLLLEQALQAPSPVVLAAVTLGLSVAWLSITASDPT